MTDENLKFKDDRLNALWRFIEYVADSKHKSMLYLLEQSLHDFDNDLRVQRNSNAKELSDIRDGLYDFYMDSKDDSSLIEQIIWDEEPKLHYLNLYIQHQVYGGPEEGGWWYDEWVPIESDRPDFYERLLKEKVIEVSYEDFDAARMSLGILTDYIQGINRDRPSYTSVNSTGVYDCRIERRPAFYKNNYAPYS